LTFVGALFGLELITKKTIATVDILSFDYNTFLGKIKHDRIHVTIEIFQINPISSE